MAETDTELNVFSASISAALSDFERLRSRIEDAGHDIHQLRLRHDLGYDHEDELMEAIGYVGLAGMNMQCVIDELSIIAGALSKREEA
jgi:anti-sigma regulatory factor (Ser/Thr protein kinase)